MLTRVISSLVGIPLLLLFVYLGNNYFLALVMLLSLVASVELSRLLKRMNIRDMQVFLGAGALLFPLLLSFEPAWLPSFLALFVFSGALIALSLYPEAKLGDMGTNFLCILYIAFGFAHFVLLRQMEQGLLLTIYAFIIVWLTDTGAYLVGTYLGKRPLFQQLSPSKTVEGAIGGLIIAVAGAFFFCVMVNRKLPLAHMGFLIFLSPILSAAAQVGDLFESALKREARVKDSSRLIPGHGGILDRFDSALWVFPLLYHVLQLRINIFM